MPREGSHEAGKGEHQAAVWGRCRPARKLHSPAEAAGRLAICLMGSADLRRGGRQLVLQYLQSGRAGMHEEAGFLFAFPEV